MPIQTHPCPKQQLLNFHSYYAAQAWRPDEVGALSRRWAVDGGRSWVAHLRSGGVTRDEWRAVQQMVDECQALARAARSAKRTKVPMSAPRTIRSVPTTDAEMGSI